MIDPPGSIRLKASYLKEWSETCQTCYKGWIYVAYGKKNGRIRIFKFPCSCSLPSGKQLHECLNPKMLERMSPDDYFKPEDLPPYVLIRSIDLPFKLNLHKIIQEVPF